MNQTDAWTSIQVATQRIAEKFRPARIILFGSYARGTAGLDSDADLLVVSNESGSRRKQAVAIDLALDGVSVPTDILVVTAEDIEKHRDCPGSIICDAVREGKILYEQSLETATKS